MLQSLLKKIFRPTIALLLVLAIVCTGFVPGISTKEAVAAYPVAEVGPSLGATVGSFAEDTATAISTAFTAVGVSSLVVKETMDGIAYSAINLILHSMSQSIIQWINSGFQGSPSFVTDLNGFMLGIADKVAGEFIWGSKDLNFLCSPFKLDIKIALDIQYKKSRGYNSGTQCTLSSVIKNVQGFGDSLSINNWNQWFQVTTKPENNVYGSHLMAQLNLSDSIAKAAGVEQKQLDFGKGFLSKKTCDKVEGREVCRTVTPGTVIENQLNHSLGSPTRRIEVADEINEIIAALFGQLVKQAFAGVGGLLGLTQGGYGSGSGSYYADLAASTPATTTGYVNTGAILTYALQVEVEKKWRSALSEKITFYKAADEYKEASCLRATKGKYESEYVDALIQDAKSTTTINRLIAMDKEFNASIVSGGTATQTKLSNELAKMKKDGLLHTQEQLTALLISMAAIRTGEELRTYKATVDNSCNQQDYYGTI